MISEKISILISVFAFFIVGHLIKNHKKDSIKQYTINENKLSWFKIAAGISMTFAGGAAILNTASLGYTFKWYTLVDPIALILGVLIVIILFNKYRKDKGVTISDLLASKNKGLKVLIGTITSFVFLLIVAANFVASSKLVAPYFPNINPRLITLILSVIIFSYVYSGGLNSVTRTDVLQLFFIGFFLLIPVIYFFLIVASPIGQVSASNEFVKMPINYIILFSIPILFTPLSQDINIRIKSAKNKKNGIIGLIIGASFYLIIIILTSYIGISLANNGIILNDTESAYSVFFKTYFNNFGFIGVIAALAAIISSLDSYALNGISSISNDLLSNFFTHKKKTESSLLNIAALIVYIISVSIAIFFNEILVLVLTALLTYISVLLPIIIGRILRLKESSILIASCIIVLLIIIVEIIGLEIEPKTIFYPVFGIFIMFVFYVIQKGMSWPKEN